MTTAYPRMTLDDYLKYEDESGDRHILENGELVVVPPESDQNNVIALYVLSVLLAFVPIQRMRRGTEIVVSGSRTTTRIPDLMIVSEELDLALQTMSRSIVLLDMLPPIFVLEVVSPGMRNIERDYRFKRSEYAARQIQEYWIVDPQRQQVSVLQWVAGLYEENLFQGQDLIESALFPGLQFTAQQILQAGRA